MILTSDLLMYKKYVLWIAGICPIAEMVRNTTFDDDIKTHDRYYEYLWVIDPSAKGFLLKK